MPDWDRGEQLEEGRAPGGLPGEGQESQEEFNAFLEALWGDLRPKGALEDAGKILLGGQESCRHPA